LDVEILRNRAAIKAWAVQQIAFTPAMSEEGKEASDWFHDLPVAERSRLFTDLARLTIQDADLREIANGPLGDLLRRHSSLFKAAEVVVNKVEEPREVLEFAAVTVGDSTKQDATEPDWSDSWKTSEQEFKLDVWDQN
jgi:hypothetical protein